LLRCISSLLSISMSLEIKPLLGTALPVKIRRIQEQWFWCWVFKVFKRSRKPTAETLQLKTRVEKVRFLSWRTFFVGKYTIQSTNEMAFKRTVTSREFSISRHQIWCAHAIAIVVQRKHACARKLPSCYSLSKKLVSGAETIADNNNKTLQYIFPLLIFPLSYFPAHIPSTC